MSATDELRAMLDERGVHWWAGEDERRTLWESNGLTWEYFNDDNGDAWLGFLGACEQDVTPEQAIAATLGAGTCHNADIGTEGYFKCSECGTSCSVDWECSGWDVPSFCPNCGRKVVDE